MKNIIKVSFIELVLSLLQRDFLVMSGDTLIDTPMNEMIDNHNLNGGAVTMMLKELDFSQK